MSVLTVFCDAGRIFYYAYHHQENGLYAMALHPQIIGHGHHMMILLSRLIEHIKGHDGVWFATCEEIASVWVDDERIDKNAPS